MQRRSSGPGQERRFCDVRDESVLPPIAAVILQRGDWSKSATSRQLRLGTLVYLMLEYGVGRSFAIARIRTGFNANKANVAATILSADANANTAVQLPVAVVHPKFALNVN